MTPSRRSIGLALAFGLLIGAVAGGGAVLARGPLAPSTPTGAHPTGSTALDALPVGAPSVGSGDGGVSGPQTGPGTGTTSTGTVSSGTAIAYPYPGFPGSPGVAPDHTVVVTGVGHATLAADGSGRAAAVRSALAAALADARAQADLIASTLGVSISGVLSVNTSIGDEGPFYAEPMARSGSTGPGAPVPAPADGVSLPQLGVAVTVAYSIG